MAKAKTGTFQLTERLTIPPGGARVSAVVDIASYVDVGDRQGLMIHSVDYIYQGITASTTLAQTFGAGSEPMVQVLDLNRSDLVFANDRALISSGVLRYEVNGGFSNEADLFPDNFGKTGRITVNDSLYVQGKCATIAAGEALNITAVITASIVILTQKDFMAIAIQSTAADN